MDPGISFKRPPVVETVLGVQFARLPQLATGELARYWKALGDLWPSVSFVPELEEQFETFGQPASWGGAQITLKQGASFRIQTRNAAGDRMIQAQGNRFHYNWLGHGGHDYPRYRRVRPEFSEALAGFQAFLRDEDIGAVEPNQWEVTYLNHIPKGTSWDTLQDAGAVLAPLLGHGDVPPALRAEGLGGHWHFEIVPQRGRLHVELRHGRIGSATGDEALVLKLTARGAIGGPEGRTLEEGLDLGRYTIVTAFAGITSPQAHAYWGEGR